MGTPHFVTLKNRGLIHIEGADRVDFLQGLITNDVRKLETQSSIYACLLTPQGKFLHDFFVIGGDGFILLDCEGGAHAQDLYERLLRYRLRADVQISVEEHNDVYSILSSCGATAGSQTSQTDTAIKPQDDNWWEDPRHSDMGYRSFTKPDLKERPFEDWDKRRIELTIPDGSRDLIPEKSTMDEARMDTLSAIDYDKGCYVGQELTARMHYRGLGKKHLQTVNPNALPDGADLRSTCGDIGLALVKN